jgi:tetratricopeptide (TPR) repeat protein
MIDAARVGGSTPSYTHTLAVLGQYCNQQRARSITLAQVETGFILHFFAKGQWKKPTSIDVHNADLLELNGIVSGNTVDKNGVLFHGGDRTDRKHPLLPMGYGEVLRAVGAKLDRRKAVGVTKSDTREGLFVNYWVDKATFLIRDGRRQAVSNVQLETYDKSGIQQLLADANHESSREAARCEHTMRANPYDHITAVAAAFLFENDGKYRDAESLFMRVAAQVPYHPEAHYHVARLALMRGDRRVALNEVRKALEVMPEAAAIHDLHGRILRQNNKLKEAVTAFEQAVTLEEGNGIHHYHLSLAYEAQGRSDEAVVQMALSTGQDPAPAWEMVQEEILAEHVAIVTPTAAPIAESMLHGRLADSQQAADTPIADLPVPVLTTDFSDAGPLREQEPVAAEQGRDAGVPGTPIPKLTTFDEEELPEDWAEAPLSGGEQQPLLKTITLEQRLRTVGGADPVADRPLAATPPAAPRMPTPVSPEPPPPPADWSAAPTPLAAFSTSGDLRIEPPPSPASAAMPTAPEPREGRAAAPPPEEHYAELGSGLSARLSGKSTNPMSPPPGPVPPVPTAAASAGQAPSVPAGSSNAVELATEILVIQRALAADPTRADLHRKLGFLLARQGKTAEAATEFRKALQASRTNL